MYNEGIEPDGAKNAVWDSGWTKGLVKRTPVCGEPCLSVKHGRKVFW